MPTFLPDSYSWLILSFSLLCTDLKLGTYHKSMQHFSAYLSFKFYLSSIQASVPEKSASKVLNWNLLQKILFIWVLPSGQTSKNLSQHWSLSQMLIFHSLVMPSSSSPWTKRHPLRSPEVPVVFLSLASFHCSRNLERSFVPTWRKTNLDSFLFLTEHFSASRTHFILLFLAETTPFCTVDPPWWWIDSPEYKPASSCFLCQ